MFVKSTLAALAVTLSVPFAGAAFAANDQLAKIAGVEPGLYTTAELIQIDEARKTFDDERLAFILSGENRVSRNAETGSVNAGKAQLAAIAGVSAEGFTINSLHDLIQAQESQDDEEVAYIKAVAAGEITGLNATRVTPGKVQLAALVGLDAGSHSIAELATAYELARADDHK